MRINKDLLVCIERTLVFIRFDIKNTKNIKMIDIIESCLNHQPIDLISFNLITDITGLSYSDCTSIGTDNIDLSSDYESFLKYTLNFVRISLSNQNYALAYDAVDMLHAFPNIIISRSKQKYYWMIYVKPFIKKWNAEQFKHFRRTFIKRKYSFMAFSKTSDTK